MIPDHEDYQNNEGCFWLLAVIFFNVTDDWKRILAGLLTLSAVVWLCSCEAVKSFNDNLDSVKLTESFTSGESTFTAGQEFKIFHAAKAANAK